MIPFVIACERLIFALGMTPSKAKSTLASAVDADMIRAMNTPDIAGSPASRESFLWPTPDIWFPAEDLHRLIVAVKGGPLTAAETRGKGGRKKEWPWEVVAFAAGRSAQANPERSKTHAAVAAFVLEEAERLTGRRPSLEHCEDKVREWRRILGEN
jgi:hypothetical protein